MPKHIGQNVFVEHFETDYNKQTSIDIGVIIPVNDVQNYVVHV